jgi:putative phage-type endonuclease
MKQIFLEQGTPEWLSWRRTVITASDCPVIMGSSPWVTPYQCWQRKLGLIEEQKSNDAMERGKRLEPEARTQFIKRHGIDMVPAVVESSELEFLGASLDGMSQLGGSILEIKCGGYKLHDMASKGEIPAYYQDQMQHQLLVTGAAICFYYSYNGTDGICIEVRPDPEFRNRFLPKAREFWKCVALNEPPTLHESDYKDMSNDPTWKGFEAEYAKVDEQIKGLEQVKAAYRKEIIKLANDQNCKGEKIRIMQSIMRGRVDYDQIPELNGVNLDKYRKESTKTWKILVA